MKKILFESEVFATDAVNGVMPFQFVVMQTSDKGVEKVEVIRRDFSKVCLIDDEFGERYVPDMIPEETVVATGLWKERGYEVYKDDEISAIIKKYIDKYDFETLLDLNSPDNEYDGEVKRIRQVINKDSSVEEIATAVIQAFKYSFEEDLNKDEVNEMAKAMKAEFEEMGI